MPRTEVQPSEPYLVLGYLRGLFDYVRSRHGSIQPMLDVLGLSPEDLRDPDRRIPHGMQNQVFDTAERISADVNVGLHAGEAMHFVHFGILGQLVMTCTVARELADMHGRYQRLMSTGASMEYVERNGEFIGEGTVLDPIKPGRHALEYALASHLSLVRLMAGGLPLSCSRIDVTYEEPTDSSEQARVYGCAVRYGCERLRTYIALPMLELPLIVADSASRGTLEAEARRRLDALRVPEGHPDPEVTRVKQYVAEHLAGGAPNLGAAAETLNLSERTLQRRLEAHGINYRQLVDDVRREMVGPLLRDPSLSQVDVAFLLGFSDQSAFHRAFRRWYAMNPGAYRSATHA